jgi:hypothetical protein
MLILKTIQNGRHAFSTSISKKKIFLISKYLKKFFSLSELIRRSNFVNTSFPEIIPVFKVPGKFTLIKF